MLHRALREYVADHHFERNHQGLGNVLIAPCAIVEGAYEKTSREFAGKMTSAE